MGLRVVAALLVLICSCSSRKPLSEPTIAVTPPKLIPETGASLYLIEAPADWLDDSTMPVALTIDTPKNTFLAGEQMLGLMLRYALSRKEVAFKAQGDFLITAGRPTEATLTDPESIDAPPHVGFHVKLTASVGRTPQYVKLQFEARMLTTDKRGSETAYPVAEGRVEAPIGATLVMSRLKEKDRYYFLLLRIASLEEP
jgi:hypothetical protein